MIEIMYFRGEGAIGLEIQGHAGADQPGKDPVCAGVSALALTLASNVTDLPGRRCIRLRPGQARVALQPKKGFCPVARLVFDTVFTGLQTLAALYPMYIRCQMKEEDYGITHREAPIAKIPAAFTGL